MKLRIKGNSLRFRVVRSELEAFLKDGRIQEHICLGPEEKSRLSYALEHNAQTESVTVRYHPPALAVTLPTGDVERWAGSDQVGIYATLHLGPHVTLDLIIEKDFACLHGTDEENRDAFPNPNLGVTPSSGA